MIGKLKGQIDSIYDDHFIIDVNGTGYLVFCSAKTLGQLNISKWAELLIETHVREDHIHLYGFTDPEEKSAFTILQSVKGVGTRMALSILSHLTPADIQQALNIEDTAIFNKVSGVGKKLAMRIVTELTDKQFSTKSLAGLYSEGSTGPALKNNSSSLANDAISALTGLGIPKAEAHNRVTKLLAQSENISINDLIRLALKN
jgi:Holliday junction DNA helicase RuvA